MTENPKANRFYITTPIYYANDKPHIGHAYTDILTDVRARFERLCGREVMFLSGTDEHGQKMHRAALDNGRSPKEHADLNAVNFKELLSSLNCSNDDFIRTTDPRHYASVEALWHKLNDNGDIYLDKYSGWYAVRDESYYDETELTTLEDGSKVAPSGAEVTWIEEPSYFFRLTKYRDQLLKHYKDNPEFLIPATRVNEVVSFIKSGLKDISISRVTFEWGVPVPKPSNKEAAHAADQSQHKHVIYVWLDALANYISALGYPDENDDRASFWQEAHHVVGKDILRFHGIYWPAFLLSAGLNLPKHLFAHGWWTIEGQKMSKSVGNVVDPLDIVQRYGVDPLRYFLCREMSFGQDGDFSERALKTRANADLANGLGNLAQRSLSMLWRHFDQKLPASIEEVDDAGKTLINDIKSFADDGYLKNMRKMSFNRALSDTAALVGAANRYIDALTPWTLVKQEDTKASAGQCLFTICESVRCFAILLSPFIPQASARLLDQLSVPDDQRNLSDITARCLQKGEQLREPKPVFPRIT